MSLGFVEWKIEKIKKVNETEIHSLRYVDFKME